MRKVAGDESAKADACVVHTSRAQRDAKTESRCSRFRLSSSTLASSRICFHDLHTARHDKGCGSSRGAESFCKCPRTSTSSSGGSGHSDALRGPNSCNAFAFESCQTGHLRSARSSWIRSGAGRGLLRSACTSEVHRHVLVPYGQPR